ncbi:MAG: AAA family ATPase, partial [Bdellovibrionota bacterium]
MINKFFKLKLENWRQLKKIDIEFDNNVIILTGPNGSGKTTILNILNRHFGWNLNFVSTPFLSETKQKKIWSDFYSIYKNEADIDFDKNISIGSIEYTNGTICTIFVPKIQSSNYQLQYQNQQSVIGLHIPSHRPVVVNTPVQHIPTNPKTSQQHFQDYNNLLIQTYGSQSVQNPSSTLKESLVALALFGYGNKATQGNPEYREIFEGFNDVLKKILPETIGFYELEIRTPDIVLRTRTGDFSLGAMSGGINSLFSLAWQIYMFNYNQGQSIITFDEPENHLHPSMQRELVPSLRKAFPETIFVISTHSPFVVTSDPDARVYALSYNEERHILSNKLEGAELSSSPNKILKEILDVSSVTPIWVEKRIKEILETYKGDASKLYEELKKIGLLQFELTNFNSGD